MRDTAEAQLERVFYLLSAASLANGVTYEELEEATGASRRQSARDAVVLGDRVLYHPAGGTAGADILVDSERVQVVARGASHRPLRLSGREAAALALGLRAMALESGPERAAVLRRLRLRLERFACRVPAVPAALADPDVHGPAGVYDVLHRAAAERRACRVEYLKPSSRSSRVRTIHPYALVHAERWWYALGPDAADGIVRFFRLDRVISAELIDERFTVPHGFDASSFLQEGRAFSADDAPEVRVRYRPAAARYVLERWPGLEAEPDGSCVIVHRAADPGWLVQHVLSYGPDAEVLSPEKMRRRVAYAAAGMAETWSGTATEQP